MELDILAQLSNLQATWTTFVWVFFIVVLLFFAFGAGLGKLVNTMIGVYVALAIVNTVPFFRSGEGLEIGNLVSFKVATFIIIALLMFFLVSKAAMKPAMKIDLEGKFSHKAIVAFLAAGLLTSSVLSLLPANVTGDLSSLSKMIFLSSGATSFWLIVPIVALFVFKRKIKETAAAEEGE